MNSALFTVEPFSYDEHDARIKELDDTASRELDENQKTWLNELEALEITLNIGTFTVKQQQIML